MALDVYRIMNVHCCEMQQAMKMDSKSATQSPITCSAGDVFIDETICVIICCCAGQ